MRKLRPYRCKFDFIDVYVQLSNANDELLDAPMLGRFCGDNMQDDLPRLLISTKNVIVIIFFSDAEKSDEGFHGEYEFIDAGTTPDLFVSQLECFTTCL